MVPAITSTLVSWDGNTSLGSCRLQPTWDVPSPIMVTPGSFKTLLCYHNNVRPL